MSIAENIYEKAIAGKYSGVDAIKQVCYDLTDEYETLFVAGSHTVVFLFPDDSVFAVSDNGDIALGSAGEEDQ